VQAVVEPVAGARRKAWTRVQQTEVESGGGEYVVGNPSATAVEILSLALRCHYDVAGGDGEIR
jgi:hypothetical protein